MFSAIWHARIRESGLEPYVLTFLIVLLLVHGLLSQEAYQPHPPQSVFFKRGVNCPILQLRSRSYSGSPHLYVQITLHGEPSFAY